MATVDSTGVLLSNDVDSSAIEFKLSNPYH